ncbi:MAG: hypothetical protein MK010_06470, partial [Erythrobacter sp.]|nr:hypothetical protein [Erythrobacter sp.]
MKRSAIALGCSLAAFVLSAPATAQDIVEGPIEGELAIEPNKGDGAMDGADMARFAEMMGGLFQTDPLTAEQEARLPAARGIVGVMMPDGFYGEMMGGVMEKTLGPMMAMFSSPEFILSKRLSLDESEIADLGESERRELVTLLDPAWDHRGEAIVSVVTTKMGTAF